MSEPKRSLRVFLCHASADKPQVRALYRYLREHGIQPWLDSEDLLAGQDWQVEISKAIESSDAIIICLTKNAVDKAGYVQREIKYALDKALEMPDGRIFVIPARLEDCETPYSLQRYHWVNLFEADGYTKLIKSLKIHAARLERAVIVSTQQFQAISLNSQQKAKSNIVESVKPPIKTTSFLPEPDVDEGEPRKLSRSIIIMIILIGMCACLIISSSFIFQNIISLQQTRTATDTPLSVDDLFTAAAQTLESQFTADTKTQLAISAQIESTETPISIDAAFTAAGQTVEAQFTANAETQAVSTSACDVAQFVQDVTVPDGTTYSPGDTFIKTWRLKNVGTCSWTASYLLIFASGNQMQGPSDPIRLTSNVDPGDMVDISVQLTAPSTLGEYTGFWKLHNASGLVFTNVFLKIHVK